MHHSDVAYWRYLQSLPTGHPDLPTPRVCRLLERAFQRWREKPLWLKEEDVGHLFRGRSDLDHERRRELTEWPVPLRKAAAIQRMFEIITDPQVARASGTFGVDEDEIILGTLPPFSVGQGKEFVRYLTRDEELTAMLDYLNELSPMGHIVPDHRRAVRLGITGLNERAERYATDANEGGKIFLAAVRQSLEAVSFYAGRYAEEAERLAATFTATDPRHQSLKNAAQRLRKIMSGAPETFIEAVQCVFLFHCALHWTVEIVPLGRLDRILQPYYRRDLRLGRITPAEGARGS